MQSRWDGSRAAVDEALSYNRRLWNDLVEAAGDPRPTLPCEVRQSLASLGLYVAHHTDSIAADPRPERSAR
ncbi:flagellar biosynthesis regulator FlaF [Rhodoplanes sp. TEM]|uniref:flagellar biosynthesis regulator FlaF n=1 Tax=Rhodoplanes sp. TEM TaxID=3025489 RepID=UPI00234FC795|nr:flagellar biosynthesis regulator FlaF [Rhodoplanes sp. TEM]